MISLAAENKNSSMHAAWLVLSRCRWEPGDDGVGTDGLDGGRVTLDHHGPRQPEFLELPEEELPLLGLLRRAVMFSSYFKSPERVRLRKPRDSPEANGLSPSMMGGGGAAYLLKLTTISTVFSALSSKLLPLHQLCSRSRSPSCTHTRPPGE